MSLALINPATGSGALFDLVLEESFRNPNEVTRYPIEDGSSVNDHIQEIIVSFNIIAITANSRSGRDGRARMIEWLSENKGVPLDVYTLSRGRIQNCALVDSPHRFTNMGHVEYSLEFIPLVIAESRDVTLPPRQKRSATPSGEADVGEQGTESTDSSDVEKAAEEKDQSLLSAMTGGFFG